MQENLSEDELLVKVPGSAYSLANHLDDTSTTTSEDLDEKIPTVEKHLAGV